MHFTQISKNINTSLVNGLANKCPFKDKQTPCNLVWKISSLISHPNGCQEAELMTGLDNPLKMSAAAADASAQLVLL